MVGLELLTAAIGRAGYSGLMEIGIDVSADDFLSNGSYDVNYKNPPTDPTKHVRITGREIQIKRDTGKERDTEGDIQRKRGRERKRIRKRNRDRERKKERNRHRWRQRKRGR